MVGQSAPGRVVSRPGECGRELCGTEPTAGRAPDGMTTIRVPGSREPARWYCHGCAEYGRALAELRTGPAESEGGR
ncbi:hypothetical protein [Streptomyces sp. WMMC897]|uniref:hypothetical protein n=1 Tax=Streptomyces sp. WMMC897 TaxID=3014782 RepID=UPI0022B73B1A|nr:hypothetical protein [Streptomyces sp. WMMC897]MCZ7414282.1 hypothetical protein [Streptomyces sp. WMMC897]